MSGKGKERSAPGPAPAGGPVRADEIMTAGGTPVEADIATAEGPTTAACTVSASDAAHAAAPATGAGRRTVAGKALRRSLGLVSTLAALMCVLMIQAMADRHSVRLDLTDEGAFTLSEPTSRALAELTRPVEITVFVRGNDPARTDVDGLLRQMRRQCPLLRYRVVDPFLYPDTAREMGVVKERTAVFRDPSGRTVRSRGCDELRLLSGLRRLMATTTSSVLFLTGHGEGDFLSPDPDGVRMFVDALGAAGLTVAPLDLRRNGSSIPGDCGAVVVVAPRHDLLPRELEKLREFLGAGGGMLVFADRLPGPAWRRLFDDWGLGLHGAVAVDPVQNMTGLPVDPIVTDFRAHPAVRGLEAVVLHGACPIRLRKTAGVRHESLMYSSRGSWGETSAHGPVLHYDNGVDIPPPLLLAVACERTVHWKSSLEEQTARFLFVADGDVAVNGAFRQLSNSDLALRAVEWTAGYDENVIMLPKSFIHRELYLTPGQFRLLFMLSVVGMPLLAGACGLLVQVGRQ